MNHIGKSFQNQKLKRPKSNDIIDMTRQKVAIDIMNIHRLNRSFLLFSSVTCLLDFKLSVYSNRIAKQHIHIHTISPENTLFHYYYFSLSSRVPFHFNLGFQRSNSLSIKSIDTDMNHPVDTRIFFFFF